MVKIRAKKDCLIGGYVRGDVFDVTRQNEENYYFIDKYKRPRYRQKEEFDIVDDKSPIRTVTRKEIVAGTYGRLYVEPSTSPKKVNVNFNDEDGKIFSMGLNCHLDSSELREAAHILNQIADALEDV